LSDFIHRALDAATLLALVPGAAQRGWHCGREQAFDLISFDGAGNDAIDDFEQIGDELVAFALAQRRCRPLGEDERIEPFAVPATRRRPANYWQLPRAWFSWG
jgi:hypothetical protein